MNPVRVEAITDALVDKFKLINGESPYLVNIFGNAYNKLAFWDEVNDFPSIYATAGPETRAYLPGNFKWGYVNIDIKIYTYGEDSKDTLGKLIQDIERCLDDNNQLVYDTDNNYSTTQISILSIDRDKGLLYPYGVGEMLIKIEYQVMT